METTVATSKAKTIPMRSTIAEQPHMETTTQLARQSTRESTIFFKRTSQTPVAVLFSGIKTNSKKTTTISPEVTVIKSSHSTNDLKDLTSYESVVDFGSDSHARTSLRSKTTHTVIVRNSSLKVRLR